MARKIRVRRWPRSYSSRLQREQATSQPVRVCKSFQRALKGTNWPTKMSHNGQSVKVLHSLWFADRRFRVCVPDDSEPACSTRVDENKGGAGPARSRVTSKGG